MRIAVSHSLDPDTGYAAEELLATAAEALDGHRPQAGVLLSAVDHDHPRMLAAIASRYPDLQLIGCTTDGELSSSEGFAEGSTTLMLFQSDRVTFAAGVGEHLSRDPAAATHAAVRQARCKCKQDPRLCLITPESLTTSASDILAALHRELSPSLPILGGTASDQWRFQKTYQFYGNRCFEDAIPVLLLAGDLAYSHGIASGWRPIGERCPATRSEQNVVYEIGGKTALAYYQHYLGPHPPAGEYPLAVTDERTGHTYLRAPLTYETDVGSIAFAGEVPQGALVQLSSTTRDDIIAATRSSLDQAICNYNGTTPDAALVFSCAARKQILGTRTAEEAQVMRAGLASGTPTCGFYAYGEFAPLTPGEPSRFHNETIVTVLLGERPP